MLAQRGDVLGLVGGQDHGAALADPGHQVAEPQPLLGVETRRRLVEDEQLGVAEQRLGDAHPAAHAAGQGADPAAGDVGQADQVDDPAYLVVPGPARSVNSLRIAT